MRRLPLSRADSSAEPFGTGVHPCGTPRPIRFRASSRGETYGTLKLDAVVHWSIPVNNLEVGELYGEIVGLDHVGRLATSRMSCFALGGNHILLCERKEPIERRCSRPSCSGFRDIGIPIREPIDYRPTGFFTGRQFFVLDPGGNRIERRDSSWKTGMPMPTYE
jgi:hypothetical protein